MTDGEPDPAQVAELVDQIESLFAGRHPALIGAALVSLTATRLDGHVVLRKRLADGREAKRRAGGHIGGSAPFGFHKIGIGRAARLEPVPEQQDALCRMLKMKAEGKSLRTIAAELGVHGHKISHVSVKAALTRAERHGAVQPGFNETENTGGCDA